jgi:hypothetical protein
MRPSGILSWGERERQQEGQQRAESRERQQEGQRESSGERRAESGEQCAGSRILVAPTLSP